MYENSPESPPHVLVDRQESRAVDSRQLSVQSVATELSPPHVLLDRAISASGRYLIEVKSSVQNPPQTTAVRAGAHAALFEVLVTRLLGKLQP